MKYIQKTQEPSEFKKWKEAANDDWKPFFDDMPGNVKQPLQRALMIEQGHICCYCESRLEENNSHIEHFRPQYRFPGEELNFSNMLCSCQRNLLKREPRHCGNAKGKWFDDNLLISPMDPGCETRFRYTDDGSIHPLNEEDEAAKVTIENLGLNVDKLKTLRKGTIDAILEPDNPQKSQEEIHLDIKLYLERDEQGRFQPFYTTIQYKKST